MSKIHTKATTMEIGDPTSQGDLKSATNPNEWVTGHISTPELTLDQEKELLKSPEPTDASDRFRVPKERSLVAFLRVRLNTIPPYKTNPRGSGRTETSTGRQQYAI